MSSSDSDGALVPHDLATELVELIRAKGSPIEPIPSSAKSIGTLVRPVRSVLFDVYGTLFASSSGDISVARATATVGEDHRPEQAPDVLQEGHLFIRALRDGGCRILDEEACGRVARSEYFELIESVHREKKSAGIDCPEVDIISVWRGVLEELTGCALVEVPEDPGTVYRTATAYECETNPVWPMPGALRLLRQLSAADVVLGIVSNAQFYTPLLFPAHFRRTLAELQFDNRLCVWSYQIGVAKPSIRLFVDVAESLVRLHGIPPEEVLYIGNDVKNDILPASEAGFQTCLFAGDLRSLRLREDDPACREIRPTCTVTELPEIETIAV